MTTLPSPKRARFDDSTVVLPRGLPDFNAGHTEQPIEVALRVLRSVLTSDATAVEMAARVVAYSQLCRHYPFLKDPYPSGEKRYRLLRGKVEIPSDYRTTSTYLPALAVAYVLLGRDGVSRWSEAPAVSSLMDRVSLNDFWRQMDAHEQQLLTSGELNQAFLYKVHLRGFEFPPGNQDIKKIFQIEGKGGDQEFEGRWIHILQFLQGTSSDPSVAYLLLDHPMESGSSDGEFFRQKPPPGARFMTPEGMVSFRRDLTRVLETRVWSDEVESCYRKLFGKEHSAFLNRAIPPIRLGATGGRAGQLPICLDCQKVELRKSEQHLTVFQQDDQWKNLAYTSLAGGAFWDGDYEFDFVMLPWPLVSSEAPVPSKGLQKLFAWIENASIDPKQRLIPFTFLGDAHRQVAKRFPGQSRKLSKVVRSIEVDSAEVSILTNCGFTAYSLFAAIVGCRAEATTALSLDGIVNKVCDSVASILQMRGKELLQEKDESKFLIYQVGVLSRRWTCQEVTGSEEGSGHTWLVFQYLVTQERGTEKKYDVRYRWFQSYQNQSRLYDDLLKQRHYSQYGDGSYSLDQIRERFSNVQRACSSSRWTEKENELWRELFGASHRELLGKKPSDKNSLPSATVRYLEVKADRALRKVQKLEQTRAKPWFPKIQYLSMEEFLKRRPATSGDPMVLRVSFLDK